MIELKIASKSAKKTYSADAITDGTVTWTTERSGTPGKLEYTIVKTGTMSYLEGDKTTLTLDGHNMFSGYVFKKSKSLDKIKTICYDQLRYLKAKQTYKFVGMTAAGVIRQIAKDFDLDVGYIEPVQTVLPGKIYENKTLLDIITDCVSQTSIATGKVYVFYDDFGELTLKAAENMKSNYVIGNESYATGYTYDTSIDDAYNYIKLVYLNKESGNGDAYVAEDSGAIKDWGFLQYYEKVDNMNEAQIKERAKQYLDYYCQRHRTLKISALGIPEIRAGSMITIDIPGLGDINLKKMLLVDKCTHKISSGSHTMDLEMKVYNG